jgi:N-dimethylarginine dimethylaminohydrolase
MLSATFSTVIASTVENVTIAERTITDTSTRSEAPRRYLMCPPTHFEVAYRINPWMHQGGPVDAVLAARQWRQIADAYLTGEHVVVTMEAVGGLPDMVFTANAGLVIGGRVLVSRFRHRQRRGEEAAFAACFRRLGFTEVCQASHVNEGEGDYLCAGGVILGGSGFRTDRRSHDEVAEYFGRPVVGLELVDERFYHLDTALAVLADDVVAYWPGAFSSESIGLLRDLFPDAVLASEADAAQFGLNACSDGANVVMARAPELESRLHDRGFTTVAVDTSELRKSGGSVKCCTLELRW